MSRFFHNICENQCKFIVGQKPWQLRPRGTQHMLAVACADPTAGHGAPYCPHHTTVTAPEAPARAVSPPRSEVAPRQARADREPDLVEMLF